MYNSSLTGKEPIKKQNKNKILKETFSYLFNGKECVHTVIICGGVTIGKLPINKARLHEN